MSLGLNSGLGLGIGPVTNKNAEVVVSKQINTHNAHNNHHTQNTHTNLLTNTDNPNFSICYTNMYTQIKKYENAKFGNKSNGVIVSYGANTHQGIYR
jgi:hypothetical protein